MAKTDTLTKNFNNFIPTGFKLNIDKIPNVTYFCQSASLPGISMNPVLLTNRFRDVPVAGDKAQYNELRVRFVIDEELRNWLEIYNWIKGMTFPESHDQYVSQKNTGDGYTNLSGFYSDGNLFILSSHKNIQYKAVFTGLFPTTLTDIDMDSSLGDIDAITADVSFSYVEYRIERLISDHG